MLKAYKKYKVTDNMEEYLRDEGYANASEVAKFFEDELGGIEYEQDSPLSMAYFCLEGPELDLDQLDSIFGSGVLEAALKGVYEMYKRGISYTDVHPGNVLKDSKGNLK